MKPDFIFLSEVWIYQFESSMFCIPGYQIFACCNNNYRAGGVLAFVKDCYYDYCEEIEIIMNKADILKLNFKFQNLSTSILILYRFHGNIKDFLKEFEHILINEKYNNLIVVGDININILNEFKSSEKDDYLNLMSEHGLESCIKVPTRVTPSSKSCIDHIFIRYNGPFNINKFQSAVFDLSLSDHFATILNINGLENTVFPEASFLLEKNKTDFVALNQSLRFELWPEVLTSNDPSIAFDYFINTLCEHISSCEKNGTKTNNKLKMLQPWMNPTLCGKIKFKNKLGRKCSRLPDNSKAKKRYKNYSQNLKKEIRVVKETFYKNKFANAKGDSKTEWQIVNNLLNRNLPNNSFSCIEVNGENIYNKHQISNIFNSKFSDVPYCSSMFSSSYLGNFFEPFSSLELINLIFSLDNSHSISHLGLSNFLLKKICFNIVDILTFIFNLCLLKGVFPSALKLALTIPLFKKGDKKNIENYRPISMLDSTSKLFEKLVKSRTLNYLNKISFFSDLQFGFRKGMSTEDALLKVTTEIYDSLNSNLKTAALFIDIKKAFDSVDHSILLTKLYKIGFRGNVFDLFSSYLSDRKQCVVIDGCKSDFKNIKLGVPQGSVMGPVLFLIYFNSLLNQKFKGNVTAFADDVAITYSNKTMFELVCDINHDLDLIRRWLSFHKLLLSPKTKIMMFSIKTSHLCTSDFVFHDSSCRRFNLSNLSFNNSLSCSSKCFQIEIVDSFPYLGIFLDKNFNWSVQTNNLESYCLSVIRQFYYLKKFCSVDLLRTIYFALFHSKISYGIVCWGGTYDCYIAPISARQKCIIRLMLNKHRMESSFELFTFLKILPFVHLFYFCTLKTFFRKCGFWQVRFSEHYNLRRNNMRLVEIPVHNVQHYLNAFVSIAPRLYNEIPREILNSISLSKILNDIKTWLFLFNHSQIKNLLRIII